ncbi:unnamed protein product [Effrenium voratum]|nr:unnamed protein product [Effrenium voratum]
MALRWEALTARAVGLPQRQEDVAMPSREEAADQSLSVLRNLGMDLTNVEDSLGHRDVVESQQMPEAKRPLIAGLSPLAMGSPVQGGFTFSPGFMLPNLASPGPLGSPVEPVCKKPELKKRFDGRNATGIARSYKMQYQKRSTSDKSAVKCAFLNSSV